MPVIVSWACCSRAGQLLRHLKQGLAGKVTASQSQQATKWEPVAMISCANINVSFNWEVDSHRPAGWLRGEGSAGCQTWWPEVSHQKPHGRRREPTSTRSPLTSTGTLRTQVKKSCIHTRVSTCTHKKTYTLNTYKTHTSTLHKYKNKSLSYYFKERSHWQPSLSCDCNQSRGKAEAE